MKLPDGTFPPVGSGPQRLKSKTHMSSHALGCALAWSAGVLAVLLAFLWWITS